MTNQQGQVAYAHMIDKAADVDGNDAGQIFEAAADPFPAVVETSSREGSSLQRNARRTHRAGQWYMPTSPSITISWRA